MSSRVKYIDTAGNESVLVKSMADQMREYAQREDLEGYEIILVAHSVGTTELAVMYSTPN
jgi:protoheme ferro-lyase